jgi:hypothetical protein
LRYLPDECKYKTTLSFALAAEDGAIITNSLSVFAIYGQIQTPECGKLQAAKQVESKAELYTSYGTPLHLTAFSMRRNELDCYLEWGAQVEDRTVP